MLFPPLHWGRLPAGPIKPRSAIPLTTSEPVRLSYDAVVLTGSCRAVCF